MTSFPRNSEWEGIPPEDTEGNKQKMTKIGNVEFVEKENAIVQEVHIG